MHLTILSLLLTALTVAPDAGESRHITPQGTPEHGMEILDLELLPTGDVTVTTSGARIEITGSGVRFWRRIDPAVNDVAPREVGRIEFATPARPWSVGTLSRRACVLRSPVLELDIRSDSLTFLRCVAPEGSFTYRYRSLLPDPPWAKGHGADRMWADLGGGSLHLSVPGARVQAADTRPDGMTVTLPPASASAVSVFPPRRFDFDKLYGRNARPHVYQVYQADRLAAETRRLDGLARRGFGVICVYARCYANSRVYGGRRGETPLPSADGRRLEYRIKEPHLVDPFVQAARRKGFKVIAYMQSHHFSPARQPLETTLAFMREFQQRHHFDGWHFDHAGIGDWLESYDFVRRVRADIGEEGVLFHHHSVDIWGVWSGRAMVPIDAYMDYTIKGETGKLAEVHTPNDPYVAFYAGGYGLSQAIGSHRQLSNNQIALTLADDMRLAGQNLNGTIRVASWMLADWDRYYRPYYEARRARYLAGSFSPAVTWPVEWFRHIEKVSVTTPSPTTAVIEWRTDRPAMSQVRYSPVDRRGRFDLRICERPEDPCTAVLDRRPTRRHVVTLTNLEPGTDYRFAVRSSNGAPGAAEVIWGWPRVGSFQTPKR